MTMSYTAVIAVKNGIEYIDLAIESIEKQSFQPAKIIVIDDNSTDLTFTHISKNYRYIELIKSPYSGQQLALSYALGLVKSEYVAFLDADDYWDYDKQIVQSATFEENPEIDVVCSGTRNFLNSKSDKLDFSQNTKEFKESRQFSACTFRTSIFAEKFPLTKKIGHFQWQISWWANAIEKGLKYQHTGKVQLNRRVHSENSWNTDTSMGTRQLFEFLRLHKGQNK